MRSLSTWAAHGYFDLQHQAARDGARPSQQRSKDSPHYSSRIPAGADSWSGLGPAARSAGKPSRDKHVRLQQGPGSPHARHSI